MSQVLVEHNRDVKPAEREKQWHFVVESATWKLFSRDRSDNGWTPLRLERKDRGFIHNRRRHWWFAWNGQRLSRNHDTGHLAEHHPDAAGWVVEQMRGRA